jgi:hypothetical protein
LTILFITDYFGSRTLDYLFITEKNRKNRKKQKLLPAASACGNVNANLNLNYYRRSLSLRKLGSRTLALFSLQKRTEKTEKTEIACLTASAEGNGPKATLTLTLTLTLTITITLTLTVLDVNT